MMNYLNSMLGKQVKIDRGGPESRTGLLLEVKDDFFTLLTKEDGVIYYNMHHIKSLTRDVKKENETPVVLPEGFEFHTSDTFNGILNCLCYSWVKVNRGGPEKIEGVLVGVDEQGITLVLKDQMVNLSNYHLRNISYGNIPFQSSEEEANEEANKEANKTNNEDKKDK